MKMTSIRTFLCTSVLLLFLGSFVHDHKLISAQISKSNDRVWTLELDFNTYNIEKSLRAYYKDSELQFSYEKDFQIKLLNYLTEHLDLEVNKHAKAKISEMKFDFDHHATSIRLSLSEIPERPDYWSIQIQPGTESNEQTVMLRFNLGHNSRLIKLIAKNNYKTTVVRGTDGTVREIQE